MRSLCFFDTFRNGSAPWFMIALMLLIIQFHKTQNRIYKLLIVFSGILFYSVISLLKSRTIYVATAIGIGLFFISVYQEYSRKTRHNLVLLLFLGAIVMLGSYKGFAVCSTIIDYSSTAYKERFSNGELPDWIQKLLDEGKTESLSKNYTALQYEEVRSALSETPEGKNANENLSLLTSAGIEEYSTEQDIASSESSDSDVDVSQEGLSDPRSFLKDITTLTDRTTIWNCLFRALIKQPARLLFGMPRDKIMAAVKEDGGFTRELEHTHNMFTESLAVSGALGAILLLVFCVMIGIKIFKAVFIEECFERRQIAILVFSMSLKGITEPLMDMHTMTTSAFFVVFIALFISMDNEKKEKNCILQRHIM